MRVKLSDHFTFSKLIRFVLPSIIMMVFTSVYGVVDGFFVSNYVGKAPFAALNLIMPFIMILGGMGFMIGTGGSALVAKELGSGNKDRANKYFSMMIIFTTLLGVLLTVIGIVFTRPVAYFLGATQDIVEDCVLYGRIVIAFTCSYMLQNVFQSFLAAAEKPKLGLLVTVSAGLTNIILDYLFIAVFPFGLAGAALATGIGQCVGGIIPLIYFLRKNDSLLQLKRTSLEIKPLLKACGNGSSELMSNISSSFVSMLYNFQLLKYFGQDGVSAYGVLMYVQFIFVAIFIGYSVGSAPIISYHYGAQNNGELKNILKKSTIIMAVTSVAMFATAILFASPLSKIFVGYDENLLALTTHAFKMFSFCFLLAGFNIFCSSFFTALNNGTVSAIVSFLRTLIFQSGAVLLLPIIIGVDGIWLANTIAEVFAFIISLFFLIAMRKKYNYM